MLKGMDRHALGRLVVDFATLKELLSHRTARYVFVLFSRLSARALGRMKHCRKPRNPDTEAQMSTVNATDKYLHYYLQIAVRLEYLLF